MNRHEKRNIIIYVLTIFFVVIYLYKYVSNQNIVILENDLSNATKLEACGTDIIKQELDIFHKDRTIKSMEVYFGEVSLDEESELLFSLAQGDKK